MSDYVESKRRCYHCEERKRATTTSSRQVGGSYRSGSYSRQCVICEDCVRSLLAYAKTSSSYSVSNWDVAGLKWAARDFDRTGVDEGTD